MLILGQAAEQARSLMAAALVSFAAQRSKNQQQPAAATPAGVWLLEAAATDATEAPDQSQTLAQLASELNLPHVVIGRREMPDRLDELTKEIERRQSEGDENAAPVYLMIHNLSRFRDLRRDENDIGFHSVAANNRNNHRTSSGKPFYAKVQQSASIRSCGVILLQT